MIEQEHFKIRPSQVTRTFGPGAIYDNQRDSVIIMGLDAWVLEKFKIMRDEMLLLQIKRDGLKKVEWIASTSAFKKHGEPGTIPIKSFPTWSFCPICHKLVPGRNYKTRQGLKCDSYQCARRKREEGKEIPKTYPVRFVAACANGHLDDFPWYEWVHRTRAEKDACSRGNARLYLETSSQSLSLDSKTVSCRGKGCIVRSQNMSKALSKKGLEFITFGCTRSRPWLDDIDSKECADADGNRVYMKGMFKGASNMYFPLIRSAVTIPPFSDDLAEKISGAGDEIQKFRNEFDQAMYEQWLVVKFELKSKKREGAKWTLDDALEKIAKMEKFAKTNSDADVYRLEFDALSSKHDTDDKEFVTERVKKIPAGISEYVDDVVLVKKARVVSAITGFTRIDPFESDTGIKPSRLTGKALTWLPAVENRGEGIFFKFNNDALDKWQIKGSVAERFHSIMSIQGRSRKDDKSHRHSSKYIFLHTFSHVIIKTLTRLVGYPTASLTERIYCGDGMAGIFIFTSSPSSDGALGGLVELGRGDAANIWNVLHNARSESTRCSCDPLCSMLEPGEAQRLSGAACHACVLLPETCCESMNSLLDRNMICRTLRPETMGFIKP